MYSRPPYRPPGVNKNPPQVVPKVAGIDYPDDTSSTKKKKLKLMHTPPSKDMESDDDDEEGVVAEEGEEGEGEVDDDDDDDPKKSIINFNLLGTLELEPDIVEAIKRHPKMFADIAFSHVEKLGYRTGRSRVLPYTKFYKQPGVKNGGRNKSGCFGSDSKFQNHIIDKHPKVAIQTYKQMAEKLSSGAATLVVAPARDTAALTAATSVESKLFEGKIFNVAIHNPQLQGATIKELLSHSATVTENVVRCNYVISTPQALFEPYFAFHALYSPIIHVSFIEACIEKNAIVDCIPYRIMNTYHLSQDVRFTANNLRESIDVPQRIFKNRIFSIFATVDNTAHKALCDLIKTNGGSIGTHENSDLIVCWIDAVSTKQVVDTYNKIKKDHESKMVNQFYFQRCLEQARYVPPEEMSPTDEWKLMYDFSLLNVYTKFNTKTYPNGPGLLKEVYPFGIKLHFQGVIIDNVNYHVNQMVLVKQPNNHYPMNSQSTEYVKEGNVIIYGRILSLFYDDDEMQAVIKKYTLQPNAAMNVLAATKSYIICGCSLIQSSVYLIPKQYKHCSFTGDDVPHRFRAFQLA